MKCPYCSKEMQIGYFENGRQPIHWIPEGKKSAVLAGAIAKDGVCLRNQGSVWKGYSAEAHYCGSCQMVIAKTER